MTNCDYATPPLLLPTRENAQNEITCLCQNPQFRVLSNVARYVIPELPPTFAWLKTVEETNNEALTALQQFVGTAFTASDIAACRTCGIWPGTLVLYACKEENSSQIIVVLCVMTPCGLLSTMRDPIPWHGNWTRGIVEAAAAWLDVTHSVRIMNRYINLFLNFTTILTNNETTRLQRRQINETIGDMVAKDVNIGTIGYSRTLWRLRGRLDLLHGLHTAAYSAGYSPERLIQFMEDYVSQNTEVTPQTRHPSPSRNRGGPITMPRATPGIKIPQRKHRHIRIRK